MKAFVVALAALQLVAADEQPTDGVVIGHLFPGCGGRRVGGHKPLTVPVDRCLTTPGYGLQIKTAAVCANGTRAPIARFSDSKCGYGTLSETYPLLSVTDRDLGRCLSMGVAGDKEKVNSVAFWCDGVKKTSPEDDEKEKEPEDADKSRKGSVSESACMPGKAPFFNHPTTDTCVNLRTSKMKVYSAGICANGTQSTLALYQEKACVGEPTTFLDIKEEDTKSCMDLEGVSSFAFYCTGEGIAGSPESPSNPAPSQPKQGGNIMHFFLILALICMMFFLMLVLSIFTWVRKYGGSAGKLIQLVQGLFKPKDGAIAI